MWSKAEFSASLLQSSLSRNSSEILAVVLLNVFCGNDENIFLLGFVQQHKSFVYTFFDQFNKIKYIIKVNDPKPFNSSVYMTSKLTDLDWKVWQIFTL